MLSVAAYRLVTLAVMACFLSEAHALDPHRQFSQYVREKWSAANGLPGGAIHAIAQSPDGYLWIGTDKGLVRFDGFTFVPVQPKSLLLQNDPILGLMTDAEGDLWVRMQTAGLLRYNRGKFENLASGPNATATQVTAMARENADGMLFSDLMSGTLRLRRGKLDLVAPANIASVTMSIAETTSGKIWMGTLGAGLLYLENGRATRVTQGLTETKINCLLPVGDQELWVGTDHGLFRWSGTRFRRAALGPSLRDQPVLTILRDRDSNIWVGTARGLLRINASGTSFAEEEGIQGAGAVNTLFEDREGNLWVGGAMGLERIRDSAFITYATDKGPSSNTSGPVYVDGEDRAWFAPEKGGLYWIKDGHIHAVEPALLGKDVIYSIAGRDHEIWIGRRQGGLTHLGYSSGLVTTETYGRANGLAQNSVYVTYQSRDGGVWAGTLSSGISRLKDGKFTTYTTTNGLASNMVSSALEGHDGTMWFGTPSGLSTLANGQWRTYSVQDGLPSNNVNCLFEDSARVLWIGTSAGLAYFQMGRMHTLQEVPQSLREQIVGMAEDKSGRFWIATSDHVLRVPRDKLQSGVVTAADVREYGQADGLERTEGVKRSRSVVSDSAGRIWFSLSSGLSVVNPSQITDNSVPALPHIEGITADNNTANLDASIRIPPSPRRITFEYTGLSLAVPGRIRFRYFLEGFDTSWSQPVAAREAVYTNLGPRSYRFRLVASNSEGLWNGPETAIALNVAPAYYQTYWFRLSCVAAFLGMLAAAYQLRLRQLARQFNIRMEARVNERTRIARDLHDTMLQTFQGVLLQFYGLSAMLADRPEAQQKLEGLLAQEQQAINEGREAVLGLRSSTVIANDLARAFTALGEELAAKQNSHSPVAFQVEVEGETRDLHPILRDEVYRIACEALRNAFQHSGAARIEVGIHYDDRQFWVCIRDNGKGIDPKVLNAGEREGHYGLPGMHERAKLAGGRLVVKSRVNSGTEAEIIIPAALAYAKSRSPSRSIG
jgi:ligand-binding sensor domain-containing protein/signal transduction histidine kinase